MGHPNMNLGYCNFVTDREGEFDEWNALSEGGESILVVNIDNGSSISIAVGSAPSSSTTTTTTAAVATVATTVATPTTTTTAGRSLETSINLEEHFLLLLGTSLWCG